MTQSQIQQVRELVALEAKFQELKKVQNAIKLDAESYTGDSAITYSTTFSFYLRPDILLEAIAKQISLVSVQILEIEKSFGV